MPIGAAVAERQVSLDPPDRARTAAASARQLALFDYTATNRRPTARFALKALHSQQAQFLSHASVTFPLVRDEAGLRAIDLFCGAGGLSEGFRQARFEVSFALDSDADACATYERNHRSTDLEHGSIELLSATEIRRRSGGDVDVVIGGPSCQGFSTARKVRWDDPHSDRNRLWTKMLDVVAAVRPRAFLLENVPGLVMWKDGNFGSAILKEFRALGYTVEEPRILLAADYGVPQRRRRLFIVGVLGDKPFTWPRPTHMGGWRRDTIARWELERRSTNLYRHIGCWEALSDLPTIIGENPTYTSLPLTPFQRTIRRRTSVLRDHDAAELGDRYRSLVQHVPQGGTWRDIPPYLLPQRFRGMRRTDSSNLIGRLDPNLPAYTITTQFTNVTVGCFIHPYEDRSLSVREAARLQTFPDRYRFVGSLGSRARQVGNAVPPVLAAALADAIAAHIRGYDEPTTGVWQPIRPATASPSAPSIDGRQTRRATPLTPPTPEGLLRKALADMGVRGYRIRTKPVANLARSVDLVFDASRVAVLVNGCFMHGCPTDARDTKSNTKWWHKRIQANQARDADTAAKLRGAGWSVVFVWEHEPPEHAAALVIRELRSAKSASPWYEDEVARQHEAG